MKYYWRVRTRLPEREGEPCDVLARNKAIGAKKDKSWFERTGKNVFTTNSCLVVFADGFRVVTSRNYIRKLKG